MGVWISVRVNIRTAQAAARLNYNDALLLCFRGTYRTRSINRSIYLSLLYFFFARSLFLPHICLCLVQVVP